MLLYAVALFALAPVQDPIGQDPILAGKVTYSNPGAAVPALVDELSKAAHVPLFAPKAFQTDILTIRLKDVPLKDALVKIADLTAGDWEKKGDRYELVRSHAKQKAEEDEDLAKEIQMFQKAIDAQKKKLATLEPWNEQTARTLATSINDAQKTLSTMPGENFDYKAWQRVQSLDAKAPGGRATTRVLAAMDAKELASLPKDYKIVYSDKPTRMQRPLPPKALAAFDAVVNEQNIWADVAGKIFGDPEGGSYYSNSVWMKKRFDGQRGKVLFTVSKMKQGPYFSVSVEVIATNRTGSIILRGSQNISPQGMDESFQVPKAEPGEQPLPGTAMGEAMKGMFEMGPEGNRSAKLPKEILDVLLQPEQHEPIALSTGELLLKLAEAKNVNFAAEVQDELFPMGAFASAQKVTPSMFLKMMGQIGLESVPSEGWLVLKPRYPGSVRSGRVDRAILGTYVRKVAKNGRATLDDLAAYATTVDGELYGSIGFMITMFITSNQDTSYQDGSMLKLYGLMDINQRQALARGQGLAIRSLTAAQAEIVDKMVFGNRGDLQPAAQMDEAAMEDMEGIWDGLSREATEMFPNGIPSNSIIRMTQENDRVMVSLPYSGSNGARYGSQQMGAEDVAQHLYAKERPGIFPWIDSDTGWEQRKYTFASRRTMNFSFEFGTTATISRQLQDTAYESSDPFTLDQMPAEFKKEVQKHLEEMRKNYANMKPGDFGAVPTRGTSTPPPPRR